MCSSQSTIPSKSVEVELMLVAAVIAMIWGVAFSSIHKVIDLRVYLR
ncbi:MAG: hypothetical protein J7K02_07265 [Deltaproteobacteria bacterium]|nr:hypothetical protein [Deltaproteobacteria bacterium]